MRNLNRRDFIRLGGIAVIGGIAAACNRNNTPGTTGSATAASGKSLDDIIAGRNAGYAFNDANSEILSGFDQRFTFALSTSSQEYVKGGTADVYVSTSRTAPALGPFPAEYRGDGLDERKSNGVFVSRFRFPSNGTWFVLIDAKPAGRPAGLAAGQVTVGPRSNMPKPGDAAISVPTPTVDNPRGVDPICTLKPQPCSMHTISLDVALKNGKPTVLYLGTPAFCSSRLCGPVDEVIQDVSKESAFASKVNFIHIEQYKDDDPETVQKAQLAPAAAAWKLEFEPAVYFIGSDGTIEDRYIGPMDRTDIREGAGALLA